MMGSLPVPKLSGKDAKDQTNSAVQAGLLPKVWLAYPVTE